jgi:protein gp37
MKKWGEQKPVRFDESELKTDLGSDNFIFVGSSCDMFAEDINPKWVIKTLQHCEMYDNTYLFQTKNSKAFSDYAASIAALPSFSLCTTIETNRWYGDVMRNCPNPIDRYHEFGKIPYVDKYITIEPIMDFDLPDLASMINKINPIQVNVGANSDPKIKLPEPPKEKILELIEELEKFTIVKQKKNLKRLLK